MQAGKAKIILVSPDENVLKVFEDGRVLFSTLAGASELVLQKDRDGVPEGAVSAVLAFATVFMPMQDLMDISAEIARLEKEQKRLEGELNRSRGMLNNEKFLSRAPQAKIDEEKEKQQNYQKQMDGVLQMLEQMRALSK